MRRAPSKRPPSIQLWLGESDLFLGDANGPKLGEGIADAAAELAKKLGITHESTVRVIGKIDDEVLLKCAQ